MRTLRFFALIALVVTVLFACQRRDTVQNLAFVAETSSSIRGQWGNTVNNGETPTDSINRQLAARLQGSASQWVQYRWEQPVTTGEVSLFLWDYHNEVPLPEAFTISYWDGQSFVDIAQVPASSVTTGQFEKITFEPVTTTRMRLYADTALLFPANVIEWQVISYPGADPYPPIVDAGVDRDIMVNGVTYLSGSVKSVSGNARVRWSKESGPGRVRFDDPRSLEGTARVNQPGDYVFKLTASEGGVESTSTIAVKVHELPTQERLEVVHTTPYRVDNLLWEDRLKSVIVSWIPHSIRQINATVPEVRTGGIDNFIEAAKALRGEPHGRHLGYVFSNAWVYQIIESMSLGLMVDPKGDREIIEAHELYKTTLEEWIPIILAAQEPDGYLQTAYTLRDPSYIPPAAGTVTWETRWQPEHRRAHEGYVAGYFMEAAIAHHTMTEGSDMRLYNAAKKLADCWIENIGPGKIYWWDGHQGIKMALIRFARYVDEVEGYGKGDRFVQLAKFLADNRDEGSEYDQSHVPVQQQYEAVGHAVRATYSYAGMAGIATETSDIDYQSAVMSLWNNLINKKYYVTGGIGSGQTSEGFGPNFQLRHNAYNEACSSCGLMFFQHNMNSVYHDAKYVDLLEETMYNALLGSLDLAGENFYYTNPLTQNNMRYPWHGCPCCIGNIPRTLLMIPTWSYQKSHNDVYVNLFIGGSSTIEDVAGTNIEMVQETNYPWDGKVSIIVNPEEAAEFTLFVRIPDRKTSDLYEPLPAVSGYNSFALNNSPMQPVVDKGYAVITRRWEKGDRIDMELPMDIQIITSDERVEANIGQVALRRGPIIFSVERYDNGDVDRPIGNAPLSAEWRPDLLNGVVTLKGQWADGSPLLAIPNFARNNRIDQPGTNTPARSRVWIYRN